MSEFSGCQESRCTTKECRRALHNGSTGVGLGRCPNRCEDAKGKPKEIKDYTHVIGVGCYGCGAYWIPTVDPAALANAKPWELGPWSNIGHGAGSIPISEIAA